MADRSRPIMNIADVALRTNAQGDRFEAQLGQIGGQIGAEPPGLFHINRNPNAS